jgi:small-conductance mechanosensitive channel
MQQPFQTGDLIEVAGYMGFVQQVTTRGTVLMDFEGNHVQIPNATIYKDVIRNYTANPKRRSDFTVSIGYDDPIPVAQDVAMRVLTNHPAILRAPEPLVESLGAATVNLRILFWVDGNTAQTCPPAPAVATTTGARQNAASAAWCGGSAAAALWIDRA